MYLLDLSKTKGLVLKKEWLQYWPHKGINMDWPVYIGVDFTSTEDPLKEKGDYCVLLVAREIPGGKGIVLTDGFRAKVSQAEAEDKVISWILRYPTLRVVGIESIITGQMFYEDLLKNAILKESGANIQPVRFNVRKGIRYEKTLAPLFQRGRVYISDAEIEVLNHFADEWINWQGDKLADLYHDDCLDAAYALIDKAGFAVTPIGKEKKKITNPFYNQGKKKSRYDLLNMREY